MVSELMQQTLKILEGLYSKENITVYSHKSALIPITRRRNLEGLIYTYLLEILLEKLRGIKYLDIVFNVKLSWNLHMHKIISKCKMTLMAIRKH